MGKKGDVEAGFGGGATGGAAAGALYPDMAESPQLRWAFIRKVYVIVFLQILITIGVTAVVNFVHPVRDFLLSGTPASLGVLIAIVVAPFIVMLPMFYFRDRHPLNLVLLVLFTICISWAIGMACATKSGRVVLEAAVLTAAVVMGLTLYTFWAAKRGHDFGFLGPFLCAGLIVLFLYSIFQIFLPLGKAGATVFGGLGALIFSGFIIYDTNNLIKHYSYDDYVPAAISLYLDIINLFLSLLTLFNAAD